MRDNTKISVYGEFRLDWNLVTLKDICVSPKGVQTGPFGSQLHQRDYKPIGTPIITVEHLGENRIVHQDLPRVSDSDCKRLERYTLRTGDIVFSRVGSVDRRALVRKAEDGWLFSSRCLRVRPNPEYVDSRYLSYFFGFSNFKEHIRRIAVGATMPSINTNILSNLEIILPPLSEQKAIARILGTLDDKIELNQQMNRTLEATARAIFKSWFVDFDPVRAKIDGRQPEGMDAETAALFSNGFEDSELGMIPQGWRVSSVGDLCLSIENGGTPARKQKPYWDEGIISWFKTGELTDGALLRSEEKITELGLSKSSCKLWKPKTILIALYASPTVGRLGILEIEATANQACSALVADPKFGYLFLFHSLFTTRDKLQQIAVGAAQQNINQSIVREHKIIAPPSNIAKKFHERVLKLYETQVSNDRQTDTLATLRDTLLPKLMSGEIRVVEAEKMVEDMA